MRTLKLIVCHSLPLWSFFLFVILFFSPSLLVAADTGSPAAGPADQKEIDAPVSVQGYLSGKYVSRKSRFADEKIRDEDLFGELRIDLTTPRTDRYEFHFFGTGRDDVSGNRNRQDFTPFRDIGDTYRSRYQGYLYEAHLDVNQPLARVTQLRIGRQDSARDEPVFFDGIAADINLAQKLNMAVYGGAAVHFYYDIDTHWNADRLGGLGLDYSPLAGTSIGMDYLYVDNTQNLIDIDTLSRHDQLVSLKLWQRFTPDLKATAKFRYLNGEQRDLKLRVVDAIPEADLELQVAYFRQFRTQNELSNELSPFFDILGQSNPFQSYDVKVRKLFGAHFAVDGGYFQRSLLDARQESAFNRAFRRTYAVIDMIDLPINGFSLSLIGEQWKTGSRSFNSTGFDAGYAFRKGRRGPKVNVGSYYSLYKYDYYLSLGERTTVRTNYVKLEYPFAKRYALNGSYELEHGLEDYQTAKLGIRYEF